MNPFVSGIVVTGRDFCGRVDDLKFLKSHLAGAGRVFVVGPRRVGKTSLITECVRTTKKSLLRIDLYGIRSFNDLARHIVDGILSVENDLKSVSTFLKAIGNLRPQVSVDPATNAINFSLSPTARLLPESMDGLLDYIGNMKGVFVHFDEFQEIKHLPDYELLLKRMRSRIQLHNATAYVFSGSVRSDMESMFSNPSAAFFKSALRLEVGPLESPLFIQYIVRKFSKTKRKITSSAAEVIIERAFHIPGDVQRLCTAIWDITEEGDEVSELRMELGLNRVFASDRRSFEAYLNNVSAQQMSSLRALASLGGRSNMSTEFMNETGIVNSSSIHRALTALVKKDIIYKMGTTYAFCDPFLGQWIVANHI